MRGEIVEHTRRGEYQTPGEGEHAFRRARAPAAFRVADPKPLRRSPERLGVAGDGTLEVAPRLASQPVGNPACQKFRFTRDTKQKSRLPPLERNDSPPAAGSDAARRPAQRKDAAVLEWRRGSELLETLLQPFHVPLQKLLALIDRSARRECEHGQAEGLVDPKNEPPRPRVSPDDHRDPPPRGRDQKFFRCALEGRGHGEYLPRVDDARKRQTHPKGQKKNGASRPRPRPLGFSLRRKAEGRPRCGCGTRA